MHELHLNVEGRQVRLTNLDKRLWPDVPFTKRDLIRYMAQVGPALLWHLQDRPLTVVRYPNGVSEPGFYQKNAPRYTPEWITTYLAETGPGVPVRYILANNMATLLWLANQGAVEYHPWMSRVGRPDCPDYIVLDLDPTESASFDSVRRVAAAAKEWLDRLGLRAIVKTSGATGLHIVVPLEPVYPFSVTSRFAGLLATLVADSLPNLVTTKRLVARRPPGSVYVDYLQNLPGKTIVAAFSPRPTPRATVSTPFPWTDLEQVDPSRFTLDQPDRVLYYAEAYRASILQRQRIDDALRLLRTRRLLRV